MARREWQQLELRLPMVCDAADDTLRRDPPSLRLARKAASEMLDVELLTVLLGPSQEALCARLKATYGTLRSIARVHPADLRETGLTRAGVERLSAIFEIARRFGEVQFVPGEAFRGSYDVYAHFRERLAAETVEHFIAVLLDNKNRFLRHVEVGIGSLTATIVHPRDVFSRVIRDAAAAVIFVHNHPSGDPTPSREDLEITKRLREVGELVGVRVLDHIVIGAGKYVSFVDDGYW
jgi:DNA repair protein RadC